MRGLLTSLLTLLTFTGLQAQAPQSTPRVVVGLTIDQLRSDYLDAFSDLFGEKGFKRLQREGLIYNNVEYPFANIDRASAIASIYTGVTPSVNGIVGSEWLDNTSFRPINCVEDSGFLGFYTLENSSATKLLTSTIADELKIATQGKAIVYSIAPFRDAAIFGAGHAGDGAFWLNEMTGKWCGTTYYNEFPWWASQYNERKALDFRIADIVWTPYVPVQAYTYLPNNGQKDFRHKFDEGNRYKYKRIATSPFINDEINTLVGEMLTNSSIGVDSTTDFLSLTYYAGSYDNESVTKYPLEMQDAYVRLDRSIAQLLEVLDKKIGLQHVLLCITSTGYVNTDEADEEKYKIPGGEFYLNRCAALLNMYLMATYGEGQYVDAYYNQQIYINHSLIEQKGLELSEVLSKAADFLIQFSGVNEVYSSYRLLLGAWTPDIHRIRNSYHRKRSGDLIIEVLPGWTIKNEETYENHTVRYGSTPMSLVFFGYSVKPETITTPITTNHIAPTLTRLMRIRAPNACTTSALPVHGNHR
ncbi:alkaline phosphatase family protein [Bacteroides sp. 214]|uniref:alkaline phosphatase family protein n=1 Tax=Bacteroides sp. 214 TaxID=2302935 RepID=UPI0013D860DE|nr:alkaline phosphatase family protein [Bacteroides sp. 214]NDW13247.1 alkaline phosphatase family protein [Bacteroides sp. 214]